MRLLAKMCLRITAVAIMSPAILACRAQSLLFGSGSGFAGWSELVSLIPGTPGVYLRHAFYRFVLKSCKADACISFGTVFSHVGASVGHTSYIGNYCSIGDVEIADDVLIASHVSIMNGCHQHAIGRLDIPVREQTGTFEPVSIGRDTWIGERATIAASVGRHCVIGAGSLVLTPIPDYAVAVGVPAKIIKDRRDVV